MIYKTVAELLADKSRWCQGSYAKAKSGISIFPDNPKAVKFCFLGAIHRVYGRYSKAADKADSLARAAARGLNLPSSLVSVNDTHGYAKVMEVVRKAGI